PPRPGRAVGRPAPDRPRRRGRPRRGHLLRGVAERRSRPERLPAGLPRWRGADDLPGSREARPPSLRPGQATPAGARRRSVRLRPNRPALPPPAAEPHDRARPGPGGLIASNLVASGGVSPLLVSNRGLTPPARQEAAHPLRHRFSAYSTAARA